MLSYIKLSLPNFIKYNIRYISKLLFLLYSENYSDKDILQYQQRKKAITYKRFQKLRGKKNTLDLTFNTLPITTKEDYITHFSYYSKSKLLAYKTNTGGTTGTPLIMYKSRQDLAYEAAFLDYYLQKFGVNIFSSYKSIRLRGNRLSSWCMKTGHNKYSLSSYNISHENILDYYNFILKLNPEVIFCYPSSMYLLCKEIQESGIKKKLKAKVIMTSSECLFNYQFELIKQVFDAKIINLFGNTEHTIFAVDMMEGNGFEINPYYSYVENVNNSLISTSFNDKNMPFLRYKSDDTITLGAKGEILLTGREQDLAVGLSGKKYPLVGLIFGQHFDFFEHIKEMQLIQNERGKLLLTYYSEREIDNSIIVDTINTIRDITHNDLNILFYLKNTPLPKTKAGKLKFFINNITYE